MRAFIFNSGVGSRMGELTKHLPKSLLPLKNGETILGRQLRLLRQVGIKSVVISTGYLAREIEDYCKVNFPDMYFIFSHNSIYDKTNSIYSLAISSHMLHEDFIVMHGDLVFDEKILKKILKEKHPNLACINTRIDKPEKDFKGRVERGKLQKISVEIFGVDDYALQPIYKMSSELLRGWLREIEKMIDAGFSDVYAENALNNILPKMDVRVIDYHKHYIEEIDNPEDYERVSKGIRQYDFDNQELHHGEYVKRLTEVFKNKKYQRPFIVYSRAAHRNPKFKEFCEKHDAVMFNKYSPNPKYEEALEGLDLFRKEKCDVVIAIGGGSCMDIAKTIKLFSGLNPNEDYLKQEPIFVKMPLICIPTTAGTGSEATRFAVIYKDNEKVSLVHDSIFPNIAILDPLFLPGLPEYVRKSALLDAFCQAIEGYWAINANENSRVYSERALSLFLNTVNFYSDDYRFADPYMMKVAYLAGQSINISMTTASHAMSYKLTVVKGVAHGHAVSLTLPYVCEYMLEKTGNKTLLQVFDNLSHIFGVTRDNLAVKLKEVIDKFELGKVIVTEKELKELVKAVNTERLQNSPVMLDEFAVESIYRQSLKVI